MNIFQLSILVYNMYVYLMRLSVHDCSSSEILYGFLTNSYYNVVVAGIFCGLFSKKKGKVHILKEFIEI